MTPLDLSTVLIVVEYKEILRGSDQDFNMLFWKHLLLRQNYGFLINQSLNSTIFSPFFQETKPFEGVVLDTRIHPIYIMYCNYLELGSNQYAAQWNFFFPHLLGQWSYLFPQWKAICSCRFSPQYWNTCLRKCIGSNCPEIACCPYINLRVLLAIVAK